jgi:hypothetical protein
MNDILKLHKELKCQTYYINVFLIESTYWPMLKRPNTLAYSSLGDRQKSFIP